MDQDGRGAALARRGVGVERDLTAIRDAPDRTGNHVVARQVACGGHTDRLADGSGRQGQTDWVEAAPRWHRIYFRRAARAEMWGRRTRMRLGRFAAERADTLTIYNE